MHTSTAENSAESPCALGTLPLTLRASPFALCASLLALWAPVTYLTGAQWTIFEQYHYGWAVPLMCLFFAWERARGIGHGAKCPTAPIALRPCRYALPVSLSALRASRYALSALLLALCASLFALSRFLLEANPTWRAPAWGLAVGAVGITLTLLHAVGGRTWLKRFLFPVLFFFIAVPWPTPLENLVTQNLMRLNVAIVIELLNVFNIPALAHGNVIELSRGVVGVEEACSGIRSLQATLMIALFFGEYFHLRVSRRIGLVLGGIFFAMFFNVGRTFFLSWIASRYGNDAVEKWHDPAGFFVLLCFIATWLLSLALRGKAQSAKRKEQAAGSEQRNESKAPSAKRNEGGSGPGCDSRSSPPLLALCSLLIAFVFAVELSTELWFHSHETHDKPINWSAQWPQNSADFKTRSLPHTTKTMLQCSSESLANWQDSAGHQWQGIYLRWNSSNHFYGRARASLAKGHRPDACLPAMGLTLDSELPAAQTRVGDLTFNLRRYVFRTLDGQPLYVFFMVADDQTQALSAQSLSLERADRMRMALAGKRTGGQRSLELAVSGFDSPDSAWSAFEAQLPHWISFR